MKKIVFIFFLFLLVNCTKKDRLNVDVSQISANVSVKRFEKIFYTATEKKLPKIKQEFRDIFPHDVDSIWINKMKDKDELALFNEVQKVYPDFKNETKTINNLIKHVKYYYPTFIAPNIITVISNIPLEQKVILDNNTLYLSLDVFLGKDNSFYADYPEYIKQNLTTQQLVVEVAKIFAEKTLFKNTDRSFIARIIQKGKLLYAINSFLPDYKKHEIIGYTKDQLQFNELNQEFIWRYFIDKELLYSTDVKLDRRFINDAPFSKFYLDIDSKSPGKVGVWLGWQIVQTYMNNNKVTLQELLKTDNELIFKKSKYKPKKN